MCPALACIIIVTFRGLAATAAKRENTKSVSKGRLTRYISAFPSMPPSPWLVVKYRVGSKVSKYREGREVAAADLIARGALWAEGK